MRMEINVLDSSLQFIQEIISLTLALMDVSYLLQNLIMTKLDDVQLCHHLIPILISMLPEDI